MLSHRFKLGQTVTIIPGSVGRGMPPGQYVVVRLLPVAGGEPHWFNNRRLLKPIGNVPPAEAEERHYAQPEEIALAA